MTHYALFEEPDPIVPAALYFNELGQPTNELTLLPPVNRRLFLPSPRHATLPTAPGETSPSLPYFVDPPNFPPVPTPDGVLFFLQAVTGLPLEVLQPNTHILLVAIGQFVAEGGTTGQLRGEIFEVHK